MVELGSYVTPFTAEQLLYSARWIIWRLRCSDFGEIKQRCQDFLPGTSDRFSEVSHRRFHLESTYDEPYRRLPTVGELRAIMREGKSQIDSNVAREMELGKLVKEARARGDSPVEIQALIEAFDRRLETE